MKSETSYPTSNQTMKPTPKAFASRLAPFAMQLRCVCDDTLPWLISFSLGKQ